MAEEKLTRSALLLRFQEMMEAASWPDDPDRDIVLDHFRRMLPLYGRAHQHLSRSGWMRSVIEKRPVDQRGEPLPWYTYAAIDLLENKPKTDLSVFEFGSGGSTLWWAKRVAHVTSVEHSEPWVEEMRPKLPDNVVYIHEPLTPDGPYSRAAAATGRNYDIIVNDGRDRVNCARNALGSLTDKGVIVWDNSDRPRYEEGYQFLHAAGFRRVDFNGMGPINSKPWMTSIFYRDNNCLSL